MNDDYRQYLEQNLNLFDDIEMSPNSERNPIANSILPPEDIQRNINLTVQNPEVQNLSLNNNSESKKEVNPQTNTDNNRQTQLNKEQESNDFENNCLFNINYEGDEKLNFYPELPKVEINRSNSCYQYSEVQETELAEATNRVQIIHIMRVDDDKETHDVTMRDN
jgi:hypothetical protein